MNDTEERNLFKQLLEKVERLETAIIGDMKFRQKGILDIVAELSKEQEKTSNRVAALEEFKKKLYWQATAIGGFSAVLIEVLAKIRNYFN